MSGILPENFSGGTQLNPTVKNYETLIQRIKHHLGYPLVQIEVSDEQIVDFINESIEFFTKFAGYTEEFLVFDTKVYVPGQGVNVEKLINSTCMHTTSTTDKQTYGVVGVPVNSYYFYSSSAPLISIFKTVSTDDSLNIDQSYKGVLHLSGVREAVPIVLYVDTVYVSAAPYTYYINSDNLYQAGSALTLTTSESGQLIQENIQTLTISSLQTSITSVDLVYFTQGTYYTHQGSLYQAGSSSENILNDTYFKGDLILTDIQYLTPSAYNTTHSVSVVNVPPDRYYVNGNNLWKSSHTVSPSGLAYAGSMVLQDLPILTITPILTDRQVNLVNLPPNTYYTYQNQIWKSGSAVSGNSLKGTMVNNYILQLLPEVHIYNGQEVSIVPVSPNTVYFNCDYEPPVLYKSGSAVNEIVSGYSVVGSVEQQTVTNTTPYSAIISVTVDGVEYNKTNSLYLNGTTIWKTGNQINSTYIEAGTVYADNISLGVSFQEEVIDCELSIVNIDPNTYYVYNDTLYQSCSTEENIPSGYNLQGDVVQEIIEDVDFFVQGAVPGPVYNIVNLESGLYYINNNRLLQSGDSYSAGWSLSGDVIQSDISELNINVNTTLVEVVSVESGSYYINDNTLYQSGSSTGNLLSGTSLVDTGSGISLYRDPESTDITRTICLNTFYDYDLMSYRKIIDCFSYEAGESTGINTLFTLEQAMAQQIYSSYMIGNFGFDLVTWEVLKGFIDTRNKVLAQKQHFRFDNRSQMLRLIPEPRPNETYFGIVGCYIERPIKDLIKERWVYEYARALTMISVGNVRGKYSGTGLFGGGSVNGNDIRQQGLTEKDNLEKRLRTEYEDNMPPMFFVG